MNDVQRSAGGRRRSPGRRRPPGTRRPPAGGGPAASGRSSTRRAAPAGSRRRRATLWSVKKIAPMNGICDRTGIVTCGSSAMFVALETPSPRTRASPVPRNVSARPETTWSARKWMVITAWTQAEQAARPASPTSTPSHGLPVATPVENPATAPMQHHPLDPEVQDAGALGEDLADRGEEQDRAASRRPRRGRW